MSKKEEQSKAYIKPIILDRNKKYLKEDNWELGLEYADFTGYEVQCAFEAGWDACESESIEIIKTAEDHAYFAGSEAMREKLIDKACDAYCKFCGHDSIKSENRKCRQDCGCYKAFKKAMEE